MFLSDLTLDKVHFKFDCVDGSIRHSISRPYITFLFWK